MLMGSLENLLARAMFARSIKVSGWQPGAPKSREDDFPKKKCPDFFENHRTSETSMGSAALGNHAYGLYGPLPARAVFTRSIKVFRWQPGAPKSREHDFPKKKKRPTFEIHRTSDASLGSLAL